MRSIGLLAAFVVALVGAPSVARAQHDDLPCLVPRYSTLPGREISGGSIIKGAWRENDPHWHYSQLTFSHVRADIDEIDGAAIEPLRVDITALQGGYFTNAWRFGGTLPFIVARSDDPTAGDSEGMGDVSGWFAWDTKRMRGQGRTEWWGTLGALLGLPTGDESESLGFGDPFATAAAQFSIGELRRSKGTSSQETVVTTIEWLRPAWLIEVGSSYMAVLDQDEADTWRMTASITSAPWESVVVTAGLSSLREKGGGGDDGYVQDDAFVSLSLLTRNARVSGSLGARFALDDDGPRDDFILSATLTIRSTPVDRPDQADRASH